jgi:transcriptional regulator with XRE-family HTH domain
MIVEIPLVHIIELDALMKERKLSDRKLAALSGVCFTHINKLRNERSRATVPTAKKLLAALGVSDEVIDGAV